ncbi:large ribosomal subunit protein bL32m [Lepeophtheirus salmonis]|uniref:large ribosomal subunit protein bL32m n=1 Tax=Lepeophtheirus salmonis TaxID=72036 RepID=UPI001AE1A027|nr:39S ribosomal protein L32, mitochondrial-like [Lepeophtheirus salmonis]XP_040577141.1 39S ribosomal protein L32, mitochondrial-like [Lepeophtheirus salmonis]
MWIPRISQELQTFIQNLSRSFFPPSPQFALSSPALRYTPSSCQEPSPSLKDSILWGVPKRRRSLEKRMTRRFGSKQWGTCKLVPMNYRIQVDNNTGEFFQLGELAPRTFRYIMNETEIIQSKVKNIFGKGAKDADVLVQYLGEKTDSFGNNKSKIIEMETERPKFFSRHLLEKSASKKESTMVRPTGLG